MDGVIGWVIAVVFILSPLGWLADLVGGGGSSADFDTKDPGDFDES